MVGSDVALLTANDLQQDLIRELLPSEAGHSSCWTC